MKSTCEDIEAKAKTDVICTGSAQDADSAGKKYVVRMLMSGKLKAGEISEYTGPDISEVTDDIPEKV